MRKQDLESIEFAFKMIMMVLEQRKKYEKRHSFGVALDFAYDDVEKLMDVALEEVYNDDVSLSEVVARGWEFSKDCTFEQFMEAVESFVQYYNSEE